MDGTLVELARDDGTIEERRCPLSGAPAGVLAWYEARRAEGFVAHRLYLPPVDDGFQFEPGGWTGWQLVQDAITRQRLLVNGASVADVLAFAATCRSYDALADALAWFRTRG
jgi:hypothetical protein